MTETLVKQKAPDVGEQVLTQLGKPDKFTRILVTEVAPQRYRVNIRAKRDTWGEQLIESFWVVTDDNGGIVSTNPPIKRKYGNEKISCT